MTINLTRIIQGGMGAGVSGWRLAQAVSACGQLGVVSGTGLDCILARRLQDGDPGGHFRRALSMLPFPGMVHRILDRYFIPGGKAPDAPYLSVAMHTIKGNRTAQELCIAANFAEVMLARENHRSPVGINYLEKIQLPHLPSLYGAMLAGVAVVIVGAGIPLEIPAVLDAFTRHAPASYSITVCGETTDSLQPMTFNPRDFWEDNDELPALDRPHFLPIVSSDTLARMLYRRVGEGVAGFVVEHHCAGGHNAPPRGPQRLTADNEPVYGPRDTIKLEGIRKLGLPFWLAGAYGTPQRVREALAAGAAGVQVGSAFALCRESGLVETARLALVKKALLGEARVFTDGRVSPTGFPFKVAEMGGTLSRNSVYQGRKRICDLGFLRKPYTRPDGSVGYRCAAEVSGAFVGKGGNPACAVGRTCLCNALVANIGMAQILPDGGNEPCLFTLGDDLSGIRLFCSVEEPDYAAADVIRILLG